MASQLTTYLVLLGLCVAAFVSAQEDYDGSSEGGGFDYGGGGGSESVEEAGTSDESGEGTHLHPVVHSFHKRSVDNQESVRSERVRRSGHHHGYVGPVHTFVKTDHDANFKWGVKHLVGSQYGGHH